MIDHDHKFIFVHIPKTAGTSMEVALSDAWNNQQKYFVGKNNYVDVAPSSCPVTHFSIKQILKVHPETRGYFKFCFVRNTWDRLLSAYMFRHNHHTMTHKRKYESLKGFIENDGQTGNPHTHNQLKFILGENGKINMNFIGRYENLENDFKTVCDRIGIQCQLSRMKATKHEHYSRYYDQETVDLVYKKYKEEINYFNYEFESK